MPHKLVQTCKLLVTGYCLHYAPTLHQVAIGKGRSILIAFLCFRMVAGLKTLSPFLLLQTNLLQVFHFVQRQQVGYHHKPSVTKSAAHTIIILRSTFHSSMHFVACMKVVVLQSVPPKLCDEIRKKLHETTQERKQIGCLLMTRAQHTPPSSSSCRLGLCHCSRCRCSNSCI